MTRLCKEFTREHSLWYTMLWATNNAEYFSSWIGKNISPVLFLNGGNTHLVSTWYSEKEFLLEEPDSFSARLQQVLHNNAGFIDRVEKEYWRTWKEVGPYMEARKEITTPQELAKFFSHVIEWWSPMAMAFDAPDFFAITDPLCQRLLRIREHAQNFSDAIDAVYLRFLSSRVTGDTAYYLTPEEVFRFDEVASPSASALVEARREGFFVLDKKLFLIEALPRVLAESHLALDEVVVTAVREIKGASASPGHARGKVRVVLDKKSLSTFLAGEILVTHMTTPDFVPALRKAAAIITDEGGVTCHAAIISRELDKPCVIGTKIATSALRNGDEIEVDADNGVIKIL